MKKRNESRKKKAVADFLDCESASKNHAVTPDCNAELSPPALTQQPAPLYFDGDEKRCPLLFLRLSCHPCFEPYWLRGRLDRREVDL